MSASRTHELPTAGDIVVYQKPGEAGSYLLSSFQHASRLAFHARDDVIRVAAQRAAADHVDAWYAVDGQTYRNIARHRGKPVFLSSAARGAGLTPRSDVCCALPHQESRGSLACRH